MEVIEQPNGAGGDSGPCGGGAGWGAHRTPGARTDPAPADRAYGGAADVGGTLMQRNDVARMVATFPDRPPSGRVCAQHAFHESRTGSGGRERGGIRQRGGRCRWGLAKCHLESAGERGRSIWQETVLAAAADKLFRQGEDHAGLSHRVAGVVNG